MTVTIYRFFVEVVILKMLILFDTLITWSLSFCSLYWNLLIC